MKKGKYHLDVSDNIYSLEATLHNNVARLSLNYREAPIVKNDWAIKGGIADGLAGPAAGIAVASDAREKQNEMMRYSSSVEENNRKLNREIREIKVKYKMLIKKEEYKIEKINNLICDEENVTVKFKKLKFVTPEFSKTEVNNVNFKIVVNKKDEEKIISHNAIFDGSLRVSIKNDADDVIGTGVFNAPGKNSSVMEKNVFKNETVLETICIIDEKYKDFDIEKLSYEITPIYLWTIQSN